MITENLSTLQIHKLTQEQYDREFEAGRINEQAIYLTPGEEITAESIGALPNTGGTINGSIECITDQKKDIIMRVGNNQHTGTLFASNWGCFGIWSDTLGKYIYATDKDGNLFMNGTNSNNGVAPYHSGNKPYGSYWGGTMRNYTNEAQAFTDPNHYIKDIGGTGKALLLWSNQATCIVHSGGWVAFTGTSVYTGNTNHFDEYVGYNIRTARFLDGKLEVVIAPLDDDGSLTKYFNKTGVQYFYQVL